MLVWDLIICLLEFFNIFIYSFFILSKKKEGSRRGSKKGSKRGVQKGGPTFCLHPLKCHASLAPLHFFFHWKRLVIIAFDSQVHVIQVHKLLNERLFDWACRSGIYLPRNMKAAPDFSLVRDKFSVRYDC